MAVGRQMNITATQKRKNRLATDEVQKFARSGFLILDGYLESPTCDRLLRAIEDHRDQRKLIDVNMRESRFRTLNGKDVDDYLPEIKELYDHDILSLLRDLASPLDTISDRRIGLSINVTPPGGHFQLHFDRNLLTAVLYVSDAFDGGEMLLFPRIRHWLGRSHAGIFRLAQRAIDKLVRSGLYRRLARRVEIKPKRGTLVVFEGVRTLHQVKTVDRGADRISIQFAYDRPGTTYDVADYYGL